MLAFIDFFYQNRFINECARKKKLKSSSHGLGVFLRDTEELMFLIKPYAKYGSKNFNLYF